MLPSKIKYCFNCKNYCAHDNYLKFIKFIIRDYREDVFEREASACSGCGKIEIHMNLLPSVISRNGGSIRIEYPMDEEIPIEFAGKIFSPCGRYSCCWWGSTTNQITCHGL